MTYLKDQNTSRKYKHLYLKPNTLQNIINLCVAANYIHVVGLKDVHGSEELNSVTD